MTLSQTPPTVAAVIPAYNYAQFLGETIDSLLAQTPAYDRIVVVDDGSTDATLEVARSYGDRVDVLHQPNSGQLAACLRGADHVDVDYVHFIDADDTALPGLLRTVLPVLASRPAKVQFPLAAMDAVGAPTGSVFPSFADDYGRDRMLRDNASLGFYTCSPTSGNILRRDLVVGMDRSHLNLREAVDGPVMLALPHLGEPMVSLDTPLVGYRVHGGNVSQWYHPSVEQLQSELHRFASRWVEVCGLLGLAEPPFGADDPAYVLERRLMIAALQGDRGTARLAVALARQLAASGTPRSQVAALTVWALLLVVPVGPSRRALVVYRRDPARRPAAARWLVNRLRRFRELSSTATGRGVARA